MQANRKNRGKSQRRSLQIEKFEDRVVPAASIVPVEAIQVDVEPLQPAIEFSQQEGQGAKLRDGKGLEIWTAGSTTGVAEKLAESVKGYMTADSFLDGHAEEKPTNSGGYQEDSSIWSDGTFTSVVEKLAPVVNGLWHDAIPEGDDLMDLSGGEENRITFPDDLGPPGIWTDGTINNVAENLNPPGLTDMAKPNSLTAGVIEKQRPTGLVDMAEPTRATSGVVEKLAPAVDQIFHDAGEADIPVVAEPSALFILEAWLKDTFRS